MKITKEKITLVHIDFKNNLIYMVVNSNSLTPALLLNKESHNYYLRAIIG